MHINLGVLYEIELDNKDAELTKNICWVKAEDAVDESAVTMLDSDP